MYICILEFQKNGYAHLHVLIDRRIDFHWIQQVWLAIGGGKFVRIDPVPIVRVANYLSKYLAKDLFQSAAYGRYRRFTTSRGIALIPKTLKGVWRLIKTDLEHLFEIAGGKTLAVECDADGVLQTLIVSGPISP